MEEDRLILKLCSHFLSYPDQAVLKSESIREIVETIQDREQYGYLNKFLEYVDSSNFKDLSEQYVQLFDFSEQTTLFLTHTIFGDNRERGMAFVKLKMEFAKAGYYLKENELPDYYPLILEFSSIAESKFVQKIYAIHKKGLDTLYENLKEKDSPYLSLMYASMAAMKNVAGITDEEMKKDHVG